jgi:hypothetical protein
MRKDERRSKSLMCEDGCGRKKEAAEWLTSIRR